MPALSLPPAKAAHSPKPTYKNISKTHPLPTPAAAQLRLPPQAAAAAPTQAKWRRRPRIKRTRMSSLRQRIATRLVQAQHTAAILTTFNEVDMTNTMALRKRFKDEFAEKHETGLGGMSFFTRATVKALEKYPLINAQIDGTDVVQPEFVNMGIAVGTPKGLVVPVLKDTQDMGFADIEKEIRGYAKKPVTANYKWPTWKAAPSPLPMVACTAA